MIGFWHISGGAKALLVLCAVVLIAEGLYINYIMGSSVFDVFAQKTSCERVLEKWEKENPELAQDRALYEGRVAAVDYDNTNLPQARQYQGAIDEAVAAGPSFAGKYAVAQWSCGENCQNHAVVNVESGKIVAFGPRTEAGLGISLESPVMVTNPEENFPSIAEMQEADVRTLTTLANIPREYYVLVGTNDSNAGLQRICSENPLEGKL